MNKVLIVDDHPLVQWALHQVVQDLFPAAQVLLFGSARAVREYLQRSGAGERPDLVLLDLELPDEQGLALLELLCQRQPRPVVLPMSDGEHSGQSVQAVNIGAMGFVPKRLAIEEFKEAILLARDGLVFFPPKVPEPATGGSVDTRSYQTVTDLQALGLTPRQAEVASLIHQGQSNKQIVLTLGVSLDTVKDHVKAVLRLIDGHSRDDVIRAINELQKRQRAADQTGQ